MYEDSISIHESPSSARHAEDAIPPSRERAQPPAKVLLSRVPTFNLIACQQTGYPNMDFLTLLWMIIHGVYQIYHPLDLYVNLLVIVGIQR